MVGVPRSKGCGLCVKRRVKCDQARPACGKCTKYGASCPGYDKNLKFVSGKHVVRPRARGRQAVEYETQLDLSSTPAPAWELAAPVSTAPAGHHGRGRSRCQDLLRPGIPVSLPEECTPFIYNMMDQLFSIHARDEVMFSAPWFTSILNYLGRIELLDTAVTAFMLQLVGIAKRDSADVNRSRDVYGRSLGALQKALNHPVAWKATETLAATVICCVYELFAGTCDPMTWMLHVTGVSKLVQQRGPASFSTTFDKVLLRSVRPMIVIKSIFAGHDCFLDQPVWRRLSARLTKDDLEDPSRVSAPGGVVASRWANHHDSYFVLLAQLPAVVQEGLGIREARRHGLAPDLTNVPRLRQKATRLRDEFMSWFEGTLAEGAISPAVEVPSREPTSPFPTVLKFGSPWEGAIIITYWSTMLIIQECLDQYETEEDRRFAASNRELATNVLRSLEYVGQGLMGPYRVGYPIRVAYDFADPSLQSWTLSMVSRYGKNYAALSRDVYPENPVRLIEDTAAAD